MKRLNNVFEKICTYENFKQAYINATQRKLKYKEVKKMNLNPDKYINKFLQEVKEGTFTTSEYHIFNLYTGHKWREIYKLPMKDRIVQHAIMIHLEPWFRKLFIVDTYSSIKERGIHRGLKRTKQSLKKYNYQYCLKMDIQKFYPSISLNILKQKLIKKIKDKKLLNLLFNIIDSCDKGLPIGNYTSQYLANFYLTDFDKFIKNTFKNIFYARYCDDIVVLSNNKCELHKILDSAKEYLIKEELLIKDNYLIFPIKSRSIDFLGYKIYHNKVLLRKFTKKNFIKATKSQSKNKLNILGSYWGILKHANCRNLWLNYMKDFKDLHIITKHRKKVKSILNVPIIIEGILIYTKNNLTHLKLTLENNIEVDTTSIGLVEAAKQIKENDVPFCATIIETEDGFYEFT